RGKANQLLPSPLLVLVLATLVFQFLPNDLPLETIGAIPSSLPEWHWPVFKWELAQKMLVNALMLAVLGSIDSLLTSLVADNLTGEAHDSDRELVGQGVGNAVAGLVGGLPGAGATMRTVVNVRAGGDGPLSGVVHTAILFSAVLGLGALFENIPLTALSAVLIKVGIDIVDWPFLARIRQLPRFTVGLMLVVLLLTVFVDLITAVFVGVFLKNLMLLDRLSSLELGHVMVADSDSENSGLCEEEKRQLKSIGEEAVLLRITGPLSYAVSRGVVQRFNSMKQARIFLIDLSSASIIGVTTLLAIERLIKSALARGTEVRLIDSEEKHRKVFQQLNFIELIGKQNTYGSFADATCPSVIDGL
ncbi:MAG: SulP family inorganic anion transporter, partial [Gammaproteobacteria bacterium]|nr:SulP family inorganic anion transporter [Gammaproteobacteria bacterium]